MVIRSILPRRTDDKNPSKSLWIICFANLNNVKQRLHARSPKMPHVQAFEVEQHGPGGDRLVQPEKEIGKKVFR